MADQDRPPLEPDEVTRPFWDACNEERLAFQRCADCGLRWLPPSIVCPGCWSEAISWVESCGRGTVFTFAVYRRRYHPGFPPPYVVAVVELAEGPRLLSNVVGARPEAVRVGMAVQAEFVTQGGFKLPVFRPEGEER